MTREALGMIAKHKGGHNLRQGKVHTGLDHNAHNCEIAQQQQMTFQNPFEPAKVPLSKTHFSNVSTYQQQRSLHLENESSP